MRKARLETRATTSCQVVECWDWDALSSRDRSSTPSRPDWLVVPWYLNKAGKKLRDGDGSDGRVNKGAKVIRHCLWAGFTGVPPGRSRTWILDSQAPRSRNLDGVVSKLKRREKKRERNIEKHKHGQAEELFTRAVALAHPSTYIVIQPASPSVKCTPQTRKRLQTQVCQATDTACLLMSETHACLSHPFSSSSHSLNCHTLMCFVTKRPVPSLPAASCALEHVL